ASGAGALLASLVRTHFRRLDLAYLDGLEHAPAFQLGIGFTLHQFGRVGSEWRKARDLVGALVLPSIRRELPVHPSFDAHALMLETRFLRPLVAFGLAEAREAPREADELLAHPLYRKAPLFDRVVRFRFA
ncbi:MAG TPA: hypothetical protein VFY16_01205, partial [Gemmatimonadaceae bacterium]|nr:hypothetical protein [Gemmatimonadaceae bacterium]